MFSNSTKLAVTRVDFSLSFSGDGYLFTESLLPFDQPRYIAVTLSPFSSEGLVMFAYDEKVCNHIVCKLYCSILYRKMSHWKFHITEVSYMLFSMEIQIVCTRKSLQGINFIELMG